MSTGEPAGEGGGGGGESTPGGDHSAGTPIGVTGLQSGVQTGSQHPPPSPLSGCYLLVVLPEPHTAQHKDLIINRLAKGFLSWDKDSCHVDLEKELQALVTQAPEGEEARNGERLIQYATENLVTEVLIHPQTNTLLQCIRNLLASFTKHRHIIHAGYTFSGNGSWILQDGTFSLADFLDAFSEHEVQRVLHAYENSVTVDIHCTGVGDWTSSRLSKEACTRSCRVRVNPDDVLTAGVPAISSFTNYVGQYLIAQTLDQLMEPSDVVGNIRFSHPTLYVFPGGQGDAALFGINGFNMLVDGGFARKACFWDFARHLDRLDAVLLTRVNNSNIGGMSSVLRKKQEMHVYPQIGHFFCNLVERRQANSPDGDKDVDPLILNLTDLGQEMMVNLRHINLRAHPCYRDLDPINLYHKVGHGTLDMYVLSPSKDTREVRDFLTKWQASDSKLFAGSHKKDSNNLTFPIQNLVSICALIVWQPANPEDTITRILFPGSTPQNKIFEGLERLKHLEFMKHPVCSAKSLSPSTSLAALKEKTYKQKTSIIEKTIDKDIKRVSDYRKEKKETLEQKTVKGVEESTQKPAVPSAPIIPTKQPAKVDIKAKKVVENKKIEKETNTKTESRKIERELKEVKKDHVIRKIEKQEIETKKTDVVKTETEKTVIAKESKPKPEPKRKEIKETRTVVKSKVEATVKSAPKPAVAEKKLKPSIDKKDVKSSPTTPKKIINGTASRTEITKTSSTKTTVKSTSRSVSAMPAKSAKDANNRKVVESKNIALSSTPAAPAASKVPSVTAKPKSTDRKPISRRPKTGSPSKPRLPGSPAKSTRSTPTASVKSEKDLVIRRPKSDKGTTDSSAVSTPSALEVESAVKIVDKSLTEKSDDISIDSIESKVLADLKEEREVVEEIEAVLSKAERNEIARKDDQVEGDDEITAEATDKKDEDVTEEDVTAEIEDAPKKIGSRKESQEFTEEDEYLIVEKEEIYTEDSALSGEGEQKHLLDEVESEKVKKYEIPKDLDVPEEEEEEPKEKDEMEEKEKDERREKKIQFHDTLRDDEGKKPGDLSPNGKERLQEEVKDIIASATEIIQKTDSRDDSGKKDSEDITKEPSSVSPDKFDSSEKKTTDTDLKPEADQKEQIPEKLEESQDRISTLESGATTTAPTLPEDERIPLDDIKEDVDEKYVKEEVKEKVLQPVKEKLQQEIPPPVPSTTMKTLIIRETIPAIQRDIVKTPDEVADLPVHEEVDPKLYDMDDFDKVKEDKVPQTPEVKEPPTPPVKEQKGMFSFFGKVADKFEKGMDKLTGKSKKDSDKEPEEKSSKSSSPKEAKPLDKTNLGEIDMGKVFAKVGKIEPQDTFEKAKPQSPVDIKVAAIKETAAFLQQEIRETKIDTVHTVEPIIPTDLKHIEVPLESEKEPVVDDIDVPKDFVTKLEATIDGLKEKPSELVPTMEEIVSEDLVEDTKDVEALLEEASKKFVTVKDSLRDSLESLEDKIAEQIIEDIQPTKDPVKSTLVGVAERLEGFRPQYDDTADSKEPEKVKFEIPKDSEDAEDDSEEYVGPIRDLKEAVRDVGEVLAGTAGIVIDDKPKDVIEIVKKVAEVLKEDNFLSEKVLFDKTDQKGEISTEPTDEKPADSVPAKPEETTDAKPIIEGIIMPKKVGVTEELPPQEEIEEMLEAGMTRPLSAYERPAGLEVQEEPCVKIVKDPVPDVQTSPGDRFPIDKDLKDMCSEMLKDRKMPSPKESPKDEHKGKIDVMECGIEEVCTRREVKRDSAEDVEYEIEHDERLEQPEIHFEQKLSPAQAELVMVTPDSAPTSPKFTTDKVYDKELEDALSDVSKVPGVPKEIEEFISSKADVYDIIDEVIIKGQKITIEIIEYIVIVKKVSREHVIYIIEEIIINKGIPPDSVVENVDILRSQDSSNELIISSIKRVEIEEYIITEYIMKGKRITVQIIEEIAIKKVVPKRIIIEIIEEIIIKRKISRESVYELNEEEFIKQVKPIYDEYDREPPQEEPDTVDDEEVLLVESEEPKKTDDKLIPKSVVADITPAKEQETSSEHDDQPKVPGEIEKQQAPEPSKEKDAPIFDEKDLDEGKLIDDFVNIPSKDAVLNFLQEERRLSHEEYIPEKKDSPTISKAATDDAVKDSGDDFEAVEQEYKVHETPKTTALTFHEKTDATDKDDVLEAVEDDLDDVVEAAEKFVEETKEKPEGLKEAPISDVVTEQVLKKDSKPVDSKPQLLSDVKDDEIQSHPPDEKLTAGKSRPDDASDGADDDSISNVTSVIASEVSNATEKYLDEDKEKTTIVAGDLPKQSMETDKITDDVKDAVKDIVGKPEPKIGDDIKDVEKPDHPKVPVTGKHDVDSKVKEDEPEHKEKPIVTNGETESPLDDSMDALKDTRDEILDIEHPTAKLDKPEPKSDDKKEDSHPKEATTDKHDVDSKLDTKEPVHGDQDHVTDVKTSPLLERDTVSDKIHEPEEDIEKEVQEIVKAEIDTDKEDVKETVAKTPGAVVPVVGKSDELEATTEQVDEKPSAPAEYQKSPSKDKPDEMKDVTDNVKQKTEELKGKDNVPDVSDVKIIDTSEIVDLKQSASEVDEEKDDKETEKIPKETTPISPDHAKDTKFVDSSCFNIDQTAAPQVLKEVVLDTHDNLKDKLSKPDHDEVKTKDEGTDKIDKEPEHTIRKKRSLVEDFVEPEAAEPEEHDLEPTETTKKSVDSALHVEEKEKIKTDDLQKVPSSNEKEIVKLEQSPEEATKSDDEDDKEVGTVRRMVVTASSEDGGHETELCPTGSITFGKSVTPDDSLRDISTKSTPDKDSLQMEKDSLYSGKSTPEKDSISEKSISELKDDKVTPEDSLEKSIHGHVSVTDEGRGKSHVVEPKEIKPDPSDEMICKFAQETAQQVHDEKPSSPADKVPEKSTEKIPEKPAEAIPQKVTDKISEKPTEEAAGKPTEKISEKASEKPKAEVPEKQVETISEKPTDKISEKPLEEVTEKPTDKVTEQTAEKVLEKPTDIPGLKSPEPIGSEEISPAETVFDKTPNERSPSEDLVESPPDDKTGAPSIPAGIANEETDASRKSSIASVKHDETEALDDKLHKDKSPSPIEKPDIISEKLDEKDSPVEVKEDKSPVSISGETTEKPVSHSITSEDSKVKDRPDDEEQKDKSPSPTVEVHSTSPKAPRVSPEESDEKRTPADKLEKEKSPPPTTEDLRGEPKSHDIISEEQEEKDIPSDKLTEDKSPLPVTDTGIDKPRSPSIVSKDLDQKDIPADKIQKDRSPSPTTDKVADQSHTPGIPSGILDEKDTSDDKLHKDKSPSPTSDHKIDRPRTPSITSEKLGEKDIPEDKDKSPLFESEKTSDKPQTPEKPREKDLLDDKLPRDRTPSPVSGEDGDKSPAPSVTSEKPDLKDITESTAQKDKSPSPAADQKPDKSGTPSITPEKPADQVTVDDEVHKDRSPSPTADKVTDKSRTSSISHEKTDEKVIPESLEQKDKSPAPTPGDKSRTPSIVSEKPVEQFIPDGKVHKERSPSPTTDEVTDRSRAPSIASDKPDTKDILGSTAEKDRSPSPTTDEKLDKSRTPSITAEKPAEQVTPDDKAPKEKSPSPTADKVTDKSRTSSISSEKSDGKDIPESHEQKDKSPAPTPGDKSRSPSIISEKPDVEGSPESTTPKDKSPSPTADEKLDKSRTPSITPGKPADQVTVDDKVHKDRSPSPTADKVTDKSRTSSISHEKTDERVIPESQEQKDKSPAPTPGDKSRTPSIVSEKPVEQFIPDGKVFKERSPSPTTDEVTDRSRAPSIASDKPDTKDILGSTAEKDRSPSPTTDEKLDKSQTPSITAEKPAEQVTPDDKAPEDKSPSPTADKVTDKSRTSSISSEKSDGKDIPESHEQKDKFPAPTPGDKSRSPSIISEKPDVEGIPESTTPKDKSPSPTADEKLDKSRTPSIISEKLDEHFVPDDKDLKDKSPTPTLDETTEKSRTPSIISEKLDAQVIPDDKVHKDKSPSPTKHQTPDGSRTSSITAEDLRTREFPDDEVQTDSAPSPATDKLTGELQKLSFAPGKPDDNDSHGPDDKVHKEKSPSPTIEKDAQESRKPSIVSEKVDEKDAPHETIHKDRSPSPITDKEHEKSRKPSTAAEEVPEKDIPDEKKPKDRTPSPTCDVVTKETRKPSITHESLDDRDETPDEKVPKEKSPSPIESRKPSISSVKLDEKNISDGEIREDKSPSPSTDKLTDKSRSPSIASEKPDEKDIPESKVQKDKSPSPTTDDKTERHSRASSIGSEKLDDKDIAHDTIHKDRSPSPTADKITDKYRSPSISSTKPDEKDIPESHVQKDKSPSPTTEEKTERHSRTSSISSEKPDYDDIPAALRICVYPYAQIHEDRALSPTEHESTGELQSPGITSGKPDDGDIPETKPQKDKSPSPTTSDKIEHPSRTSSIGSVKHEEIDSVVHVQKDKSPSPVPGGEADKSRSPSIASEKPDEKDISDLKIQKDRSPSPPADKISDKPDGKILDSEEPKDRSPSPTADKAADRSRTSSIASGKSEAPILPADKSPKDRSPSLSVDDERTKPEETSVTSEKPDDKSRSPSIISEKLDVKDIPSERHQNEKSPSPTADETIDLPEFPSVPDHKPEDKDLPKETSTADEKLDDKPKASEITPEKLGVTDTRDDKPTKEGSPSPTSDVSDKTRSPSISSEKKEEKDIPQAPSSVSDKLNDEKPDQISEKDRSPSPSTVEVADKSRSLSIESDKADVKAPIDGPRSPSIPDDKPAELDIATEDSHKSDKKIEVPDKSKSPISSTIPEQLGDTPKKEASDSLKSPVTIEDEPEVSDKLATDTDEPRIPDDGKHENISRPSSATSGKSEDSVPGDEKKDESPKAPKSLSEKPGEHPDTTTSVDKLKTLDIKPSNLVHEPKLQSPTGEGTNKTESKSPSPSTDVLPDKSRSPSIVSEKADDLIRPSSRASTKSEHEEPAEDQKSPIPTHEVGKEKEVHKSPVDGSVPEEPKSPSDESDKAEKKDTADPKSPRDRSPDKTMTPKDRSRSHSLFDSGDRTPLGRSRAASLFDDKLDDKIALLDLDAMRPSISEEIEDDKSPRKSDDSKPGSKSPSVADLHSSKHLKDSDIEDSDLPTAKRLEIEQYIVDEFILKNRKITSEIIEEIVIKKSVSRYIIIEIIEEIIVKRKIPRESVIDISENYFTKDEKTEVEDEQTIPETPEIHDDKSPRSTTEQSPLDSKRSSIASDTIPAHEIPEGKKPRGSISKEIPDPKDSTISSVIDDKTSEREHHVIKKRSILDEKSPEEDILDEITEPSKTETEKVVTDKADGPKQEGIEIKRPSVVDDKPPQHQPDEVKSVTSPSTKSSEAEALKRPSISDDKIPEFEQSKQIIDKTRKPSVVDDSIPELDSKKPEDQIKSDTKVIPTVVAKTEEGKDIHPKDFKEEGITITDAKRIDIEEYIVEEYIKRGRRITREIIEEIVIRKSVPRYIILEIIEEIIIKRKISKSSVIDFVDEEIMDKEDPEPTDRSTASSISEKDDASKLRKFSEDKFDITTGKSTPEISSAKDQTIDFSGKSTPDLKSSLLSEKYSDKSGYSTPDMRQFDERSGKSTPDYRTEYESQFHKAFVGGMTEMRTTHITTLSGKSTPDFGAGRDDVPEPKSDLPSEKLDHLPDDGSEFLPQKDKLADTVPTSKVQSEHHDGELPEKPSESKPPSTTPDQSTFTTTLSGITKATSELVTKITESTASSISTVTSKIITSQPDAKTITDESVPEEATSSSTVTTVKTSAIESEPEVITKVIRHEVEAHEPSETEVITKIVRHVTEIEADEPEIITKVIKRESITPEDKTTSSSTITTITKTIEVEESEPEIITKIIEREIENHEPSEIKVITKTIKHVTEVEESEPEIVTKVIKRESIPTENGTAFSGPSTDTVTKTIEVESEPEVVPRLIRCGIEKREPSDGTTTSVPPVTERKPSEVESEPEIFAKVIKREVETHDEPLETDIITRTVRHVTEIEEGEPEIIRKVIRREIVDPEEETTSSSRTFTTVTTSETESEPEIVTKTISREIEVHEPSEMEVITRTIRHVTEIEESEPEIITKIIKREIIVPGDDDGEEEVSITTRTSKVSEKDDSEHTAEIPKTSKTVTETLKSSEGTPEVVKRIISREGTPEVTETITTRTTRTIVSEASPSTETVTKTTTTTISSDIEKPELITRIISREGTPEISETIKRTTKTISSDAGPEYITKIISREGTPEILKTSEVKRIVTTVTTVTGPDGESVTTKDVKESSDKLDGEDLLEKLIDSSSSDKSAKSAPDVKTSEERFVSETPDGLITEEIIKRTVTTVTSSSGTSTPDVKTFIDSGKSTPDHKDDEKIQIPAKDHASEATDKSIPETSEDSSEKILTEKIKAGKTAPEIPSSSLVKGIISEDKSYSGKSSPDISMPKDIISSGSTGKSTPEIPISPLIRDSASIQGRILSGRSTPDRKSDGKSRTATPEGFRSGEVIRTIITTTRTMSDDGEIITVTKEVTESTDEQGQTVILAEKTDVKRDDNLPTRDAAETAISSVIGSIKASELKRGSSPGSDVMSDKDAGPISPRSDISSGHSRAATHVWGSSEERHTYSDDEPPSSPLSATSQFGYSPQLPRYELPFDKDVHKSGETRGATMTGSFYGELPTDPTVTKSSTKSSYTSSTTASKFSDPIPIQGEHSMKRFTVEKEFAGGYEYKMESKKYVDDADLDFDRAMMEHREKRGEDLVSHHYSNGASSVVYTNGNSKEEVKTTTTLEKKNVEKKKSDPMAASFSAEKETEDEGKAKDPLEGWGKPLFLPSPKPPRKFNLQRPVASTSSEELSPESLNFDVINNWGEPLRLPSPAPAPAPTNEISNKGSPGTPKKERKQPKKVVSENNKNKKRSESPSKNDKKTKDSKNKVQPVYMDLTYVPHHGNSYYSSLEFFKRIRARYYVFSGTEPSREVYDALLEAKKTWEDKNLEVTMIPTYDTDTLGYWVADNEEALAANHIDLSPSASRCTINLQDHETSCSAYRLEF